MSSLWRELESEYASALRDYLSNPVEAALQRAYELGRTALDKGLGVLEMVVLHQESQLRILAGAVTAVDGLAMIKMAGNFFMESLGPFEMAHRGFREANTALLRLNERLEEEARRIAHALHDEAGQFLACVHIALEEFARDLPPASRAHLQEVKGLLDEIEEQLRSLSHELRPTILDDLGLLPALEFLADRVSKRAGLSIAVGGPRDGRLPFVIETALYRIVQESLTNVSKHAQATRVRVQIRREPRMIRCSIEDDGIGFDVPAVLGRKGERGLGLVGIRERVEALGGTLEVKSQPGQGTELSIMIPLEA